jgi:hypothetical protein
MRFLVRFAFTSMMPGCEEGLHEFVDKLARESDWVFWIGQAGSAVAFMFSPILTVYWPLPAIFLPAKVLDRHAHEMNGHSLYILRNTSMLLKMGAGLHWAARADVRAQWALPPYGEDPGTWRTS